MSKQNNRMMVKFTDDKTMEFLLSDSRANSRSISQEINHLVKIGIGEVIKEKALLDAVKAGNTQFIMDGE